MRRAMVLVLVGGLVLTACGGDDTSEPSPASSTNVGDEPITIRTKINVADKEGADVIATGIILESSMLGDAPFCVGGTILDIHSEGDPIMEPYGLIARTITCPDGTVRMGYSPTGTETVSWTIIEGTGEFEGLGGTGEMTVVYGPGVDPPARETFTGTVTR